jgi:anti-anti-sigma factor
MDIKENRKGAFMVLSLSGRLDSFQAEGAKQRLLDICGGEKRVLVDCTGLEYISSAGLGVFLLLLKTMRKKEGEFWICGLNERIREVFEISGLHKVFTLYKSQEEALAAAPPG